MEIKKTPVQIPLTWLHVWILFAGFYAFAAGFLEMAGREALYFCAVSFLLLLPIAASWLLIRKTKALWQFLLCGMVVCAAMYAAAKFFCGMFSLQAAEAIASAIAAKGGKSKFENAISPAFLEQLSGVMTGCLAAVIFLIRGYVRIRKGQLKKEAQELPAGSMPLADKEAWEIPTVLDEPKPLHFLWLIVQYVTGVLLKMPFYWNLIFWLLFADVFLCFFCQYLNGMYHFIRDHRKIANLPVETMQRTGKLILKIAVLLLVLFVLPAAIYGKDPIAEAIAGYEPKEAKGDVTWEIPETQMQQGMEQGDMSEMLGDVEYQPMPAWLSNLLSGVMYLVLVAVGAAVLRAIYHGVRRAGKAFSEDEEDEVLFLHQEKDERENLPWRREKKEGYLSPNMRIRRQYKKTIKRAGKYRPAGVETPAELEEKNKLSGDGIKRLHEGYEKARYSREGCTKEEADALRNTF